MYNVYMPSIDLTEFWGALWVSGANPGCPSCGASNWGDSFVTLVPNFDPETGEIDFEDGLPAVALVCADCRFVRIHAAPLAEDAKSEDGSNGAAR
jgi:hypothetical protein